MSSFKRRQPKYVKKPYRVGNWAEYEAGLRRRGSLTVWLVRWRSRLSSRGVPAEEPLSPRSCPA
jgi:hypothetical protein